MASHSNGLDSSIFFTNDRTFAQWYIGDIREMFTPAIGPQWKTTSIEDDLNGRQTQWNTTSIEDNLN